MLSSLFGLMARWDHSPNISLRTAFVFVVIEWMPKDILPLGLRNLGRLFWQCCLDQPRVSLIVQFDMHRLNSRAN